MSLIRKWFGACCLGAATLTAGLSSAEAQSAGAPYGARDPLVCSDRSEPQNGAITPDVAARYFACGVERVSSDLLHLVADVKVQVGKGRPFLYNTDGRQNEIDPDQTVYPIRGSFLHISCSEESEILQNAGRNCIVYDQPNAAGSCYRTTFGDWRCNMHDIMNNNTVLRSNAPPPR